MSNWRETDRQAALATLRDQLGRLEAAGGLDGDGASAALATGWDAIDGVLPGGGLRLSAVHEWVDASPRTEGSRGAWSPPILLLAHLARRALATEPKGRHICWIGRAVLPYGVTLVRDEDRELLRRSIVVDPASDADRLWAIDLALRSSAVAAVIADGSKLDLNATRRLQLAAEERAGLGLLARPPTDGGRLSAATTRWRVTPAPSESFTPRWTLELARCKGAQPAQEAPRRWTLELCDASRLVVSSNLADGSSAAATGARIGARHSAHHARRSA